jgi:hypothetical protein
MAGGFLRTMVEPMLKQVPVELEAAFRRDWPLETSDSQGVYS